ncbi:hypothetical protein [Pseudoduganella sp. OTU4001]|uniref:hypothetical protein n=1 Tax=Pseudoduganella sp. OTU4001 TaxID=3043854 RepID=UPI00313DD004
MRGAVLGFLGGMLAVAWWIGGVIGWQQSHLWPAWLAVPLGAAMGPLFVIEDLITLAEGARHPLTALPQALVGGAIGGLLGCLLVRLKRK